VARDGLSRNLECCSKLELRLRLKALITAPEILMLPGVFDGFSARLVQSLGFKAATRRATTPLLSAWRLQELGAAVVMYPRLLTASSLASMRRALDALLALVDADEVHDRPGLAVSFEELNVLLGLPRIGELESRYVT
jgi:2-methylisocitrate lyase-like PEP mutase family enzyme